MFTLIRKYMTLFDNYKVINIWYIQILWCSVIVQNEEDDTESRSKNSQLGCGNLLYCLLKGSLKVSRGELTKRYRDTFLHLILGYILLFFLSYQVSPDLHFPTLVLLNYSIARSLFYALYKFFCYFLLLNNFC